MNEWEYTHMTIHDGILETAGYGVLACSREKGYAVYAEKEIDLFSGDGYAVFSLYGFGSTPKEAEEQARKLVKEYEETYIK